MFFDKGWMMLFNDGFSFFSEDWDVNRIDEITASRQAPKAAAQEQQATAWWRTAGNGSRNRARVAQAAQYGLLSQLLR